MKALSGIGVLGAITLVAPVVGSFALFWAFGATQIGPWLKTHGIVAIAAYAGVFMLLTGFALMPTYAMSAVAGYAFGLSWGTGAALLGLLGGAAIGYELARRASGNNVQNVINSNPKWKAVRDAMLGHAAMEPKSRWMRSTGFIALLRCPPNCPFSFTNLVLASVRVPRTAFLTGTFLGMAPRTAIAALIGAGIKDQMTKESTKLPLEWWIAGIVIAVVVAIIIGTIANKAVQRATGQVST